MARAIVVGAGLGGLATAVRLRAAGLEVTVFEKNDHAGGRMSTLTADGYTWDVGPTLIMMPEVLQDLFRAAGQRLEDHVDLRRLDPCYRVVFERGHLDMTSDLSAMIAGLEAVEPGAGSRYLRFLSVAERLTRRARPGLIERRFDGLLDLARPSVLTTLLGVKPWSSVASLVSAHFRSPQVRQAFSFQTLYLGTAPSRTPAAYVMIPLVEATLGVWYPMGGVWQIARAVARLATDLGVEIRLLTPVDAILTRGDRVVGVRDQSGASEHADVVVANADWGYTQSRLLASGEGVARREYGCSGVLFLLAVRGPLSGPHHAFILSPAFDGNLEDIFERRCLPELPSVYVSRPTATDPTLAPPGIELIYVLVPCPTLTSGIDWGGEIRGFRKRVLDRLTRIGWEDLEERIVAETSLTPETFGARYNLAEGSAFGLAATLVQSGPFRPTVRSRRYRGLYHAGASSHPGGGVPIVTLAGRLAAEAVLADLGRAAGSRRSVAVSRAASPGGGQRLP